MHWEDLEGAGGEGGGRGDRDGEHMKTHGCLKYLGSEKKKKKESACNVGDTANGSIPGSENFYGGRNGNPLQYTCHFHPLSAIVLTLIYICIRKEFPFLLT